MTGYKELTKKEEMFYMGKMEMMMNLGYDLRYISWLLNQPMRTILRWFDLIKARKHKHTMGNV